MSSSPLASVNATRDVLARHGLATKKALGQHFLIDDSVIKRILDRAVIEPDDYVLEVGPGIGTLTVALLAHAAGVVAIERDRDLPAVLSETCAQDSDKLALIEDDAQKVDQEAIECAMRNAFALLDSSSFRLPRLFIANLPYAVAATIVLDYFERFNFIEEATIMVQSEVADRMAATCGTKDYGAYTVKLRLRALVDGRFQVVPGCFFPPPRVDSAVVHLVRYRPLFEGEPASDALLDAAARAADAAFTQRRKNIKNSFTAYFASRGQGKETAVEILEQAKIESTVRGETLELDDFLRLGNAFLARGLSFA